MPHDRLCGTRLRTWPQQAPPRPDSSPPRPDARLSARLPRGRGCWKGCLLDEEGVAVHSTHCCRRSWAQAQGPQVAPLCLRFSTSPFLTCARLADGDKAIWRQADVPNPALLGAHPPFPSPTRLLITLAFARGSQGPQQDFGEVCLQPLVTNTVSAFPSRKFCWQGSWLPGSCLIPALGSGGGAGSQTQLRGPWWRSASCSLSRPALRPRGVCLAHVHTPARHPLQPQAQPARCSAPLDSARVEPAVLPAPPASAALRPDGRAGPGHSQTSSPLGRS